MDFTKFINSVDIREHHRSIGYKYNSLEAAWLVYQCKSVSLKEKHEAWEYIIKELEEMSDRGHSCKQKCPLSDTVDVLIPNLYQGLKGMTLHELIRRNMELENADINLLYKENSGDDAGRYIYLIKEYRKLWNGKLDWCDVDGVFSSMDKCMEFIKEENEDDDIELVTIRKILEFDKERCYDHIEATMRPDGTIMDIYSSISKPDDEDRTEMFIRDFYERLWFNFPVPFKRGDIVTIGQDWIPIVVDNIIIPDEEKKESYLERRKRGGDNSDMNLWGYYMDQGKCSDGSEFFGVSHDVFWNYMDVEYYKKELAGFERCLQPVSAFLKDEIPVDLAITAYQAIFTQEQAKRLNNFMYVEEALKSAGLEKKR